MLCYNKCQGEFMSLLNIFSYNSTTTPYFCMRVLFPVIMRYDCSGKIWKVETQRLNRLCSHKYPNGCKWETLISNKYPYSLQNISEVKRVKKTLDNRIDQHFCINIHHLKNNNFLK